MKTALMTLNRQDNKILHYIDLNRELMSLLRLFQRFQLDMDYMKSKKAVHTYQLNKMYK
jgi:hypothetical protein